MDTLLQDLRYAARTLARSRGFAVVAVLTLALGVGANTAIFSVVNSVVLRPLPYPEPERLVAFVDAGGFKGELLEFRERATSFAQIAAYSEGGNVSLTGGDEPLRLRGSAVTADLFPLLGATPALGRTFLPDEDRAGRDGVVVLGHELWRQRFGADSRIIGEQIRLDGVARTVVGVMPSDFRFPVGDIQLWIPVRFDPADRIDLWSTGAGTLVGRLRPGVSVEQAAAEVRTLAPGMRELFPWNMPADYGRSATVRPLREQLVGEAGPMLLILLGAVGLVLLIACANIANLLLARAAARQREVAIRAALGAGRWRVVRQLLTESMFLALIGGLVGFGLSVWGVELLVRGLPADTPRLAEIGIDARVLGFALVVTLLAGLLFGVLPALRASAPNLQGVLREGSRTGTGAGRRRLAGALVASEMALAVVLVIGAGLLMRSFWQLLQVDPGFRTERVVSATVAPPEFRYTNDPSRRVFFQELLQRIEALSGVRSAAATDRLPFGGSSYGSVFIIEGRPDPATEGGDWPWADISAVVSEDYLQTLGIPVLRGRGFTPADRADAPRVALVNQELARRYWPDQDPVGRRIRGPGDDEWTTVVGVVGDVKSDQLSEESKTGLYRPLLQGELGPLSVVVRTTSDPGALASELRAMVASVDGDTPVSDLRTLEQLVAESVARPRFLMLLLVVFAGVALTLGAVGIYGVLAYSVSQRTHEIGVRMALGARAEDVLRLVVREGATLALIGVVVGVVGAFAATRLLSSMLFGVSPTDPLVFAAVPLLLGAVSIIASYLPARRATRVDPMVALRAE